ncbi:MAG TPA: NAD(P)-dependent oxidoreductase [Ilumatobacteraceae bacterium]|nr:NAD(P)-dependent oxidoreductase [Ilumatobacteraceae bacterium]
MARVAFLGLGVMGSPMAGHLAKAGHDVTVYNRTASKALAWVAKHGHRASPTPAEAAEGAEFVMLCVGNDADVRSVVNGDNGALAAMDPGSVLVDHTTASAVLARELAAAATEQQVGFVDAPVSGGQAGAENGALTVMCGSDDESVFESARAVIAAYSKACERLGPAGAGQLTKMVNQICIAGIVQGLAEAVNFAQRAGLDVEHVVEVLGKGAAQSWQMDNRARTMAGGEFEFGFAVEWMRKDLGICLDEAHRNGARLPVIALVDQFYAHVVERGGRRWDTSSLVHLLQNP